MPVQAIRGCGQGHQQTIRGCRQGHQQAVKRLQTRSSTGRKEGVDRLSTDRKQNMYIKKKTRVRPGLFLYVMFYASLLTRRFSADLTRYFLACPVRIMAFLYGALIPE